MKKTSDGDTNSMAAVPSNSTFNHRSFIGRDGLRLAADVGGDPDHPSVILLHGGGQTRHSWHGTMRKLITRGYYVLNLDTRGHGESEWSATGDYSFDAMADDLVAVAASLPTLPAFVGASMGGCTALCAVGRVLSPVASALVLVDVVPRIDPKGAARIIAFMQGHPQGFATVEQAADAVAAYNPHRPRPRDFSGLMKNLRRRDDGRLYWHWDPRLLTGPNLVEPPLMAERLLDMCKGVHIPTLLVRGMESEIVSEAGVAELRAHLPNVNVFDVANAGHMVAGDRNDVFNAGILDFLARHCQSE